MRYWIGCTITTANTNISCDIEIGEGRKDGKTYSMFWKDIGGRLYIGDDAGRWFNFTPNGDHKGVVLFPNKADDDKASAYRDAEILVTLLGVPNRFAEKLGCGDYFGGEGFLHRTSEQVLWEMWYPCI